MPNRLPTYFAPRAATLVGMRGSLTRLITTALIALPLVPRSSAAQESQTLPPRGAIVGVIVDDSSRAPLAQVEVYIAAAGRFTRTDSSGRFIFGDLPKGTYDLRARRLGYEPLTKSLALTPADTVEYELGMVAAPQLITQVDVRAPSDLTDPKLADIERKKRSGIGRYLSREDIQKYDDRMLSDILMRLMSLRLIRGNRSDMVWVASSRGSGGGGNGATLTQEDQRNGADPRACYSAIYIDRGAVYQGRYGEMLFNINRVPTSVVESIEWYSSPMELPIEYNTFGPTCGALVIKTR